MPSFFRGLLGLIAAFSLLTVLHVPASAASGIGFFSAPARFSPEQFAPTDASSDTSLVLPSHIERTLSSGGLPFPSAHYPSSAYGASPRNWSIAQDSSGVVYLGNRSGLLSFDGTTWRNIPTRQNLQIPVRSIAVGSANRVFVGLSDDFGVVTSDSAHSPTYRSLSGRTPIDVTDVWSAFTTSDGAYFQSREALFLWDGTSLQSWTTKAGIHTAFAVGDRVFVRDFDRGLLVLSGSSLRPVAGGKQFVDAPVRVMLPLPGDRVLIGTAKQGLYTLDETGIAPLDSEVTSYLAEHRLYTGTRLTANTFALSTLGGGVVIITGEGRLLRILEPGRELRGSIGNALTTGRDGQLWIAFHNNGVQRIDVLSSVTVFDDTHGLDGLIDSIHRIGETLYVGTGSGLFQMGPSASRFQQVQGVPPVFDLASSDQGLLAATQLGLYLIRDGSVRRLTDETIFTVTTSRKHPGRYYLGGLDGITVYFSSLIEPGRVNAKQLPGIDFTIRRLTEGPDGSLWIPRDTTLIRVQVASDVGSIPSVQAPRVFEYSRADELPAPISGLFISAGTLYTFSASGVHRVYLQGDAARFVQDPTFFESIGKQTGFSFLTISYTGEMWTARGDQIYRATPVSDPQESPKWRSVSPLHFPKRQTGVPYIDDTSIWVSDANQLFRYDLEAPQTIFEGFPPIVREVSIVGTDSVLYGGFPPPSSRSTGPVFQAQYPESDLTIDYAAPIYNVTSPSIYQVKLVGHDATWSAPTRKTSVTYTNLEAGTYTMRVRSQNERGVLLEGAPFSFRVQPPWYQTLWAYVVYVILLSGLAYGAIQAYLLWKEARRRRMHLAQLRDQQRLNRQLKKTNRQLTRANERLEEANELKENFLSSTSHELRTPLTTILGYADVLQEESPTDLKPFANLIDASGRRLLRTLDALLHLAGLRADSYTPKPETINFADFLYEIASEFRHRAHEKDLSLTIHAPAEDVSVITDPVSSRQIIHNLVDNAVKYTRAGSVTITLEDTGQHAVVSVQDTGIGISPEFMPQIFDDFKQESRGLTREFEGSGIGLAVSKRFADLIDATISIQSTKGEGTSVTVCFPKTQWEETASDEEAPPFIEPDDVPSGDAPPGPSSTFSAPSPPQDSKASPDPGEPSSS